MQRCLTVAASLYATSESHDAFWLRRLWAVSDTKRLRMDPLDPLDPPGRNSERSDRKSRLCQAACQRGAESADDSAETVQPGGKPGNVPAETETSDVKVTGGLTPT